MSWDRRHLRGLADLAQADAARLLDRATEMKSGGHGRPLSGKVLGMVFFNPSLRTRVSFEVAAFQLGGHAVHLSVGGDAWKLESRIGVVMDSDKAEHIREAAPVLGRYCDLLAVRSFPAGHSWENDRKDPVLQAFVDHAGVPVISMESALEHPCQGLADLLTMRERLGVLRGRKLLLTWAWHPRALPMSVPRSVLLGAAMFGMDITVARPGGYDLDGPLMDRAASLCREAGGSLRTVGDPDEGYEGSQVVYAKSWGSLEDYGRPEDEAVRRARLRGWMVSGERMGRTSGGVFMHCLPVRRNVVVADEVLDSSASAVVDQAENRLHVQKAILETLSDGQ